jgi:CheY-like chemotaxis protein
MPHTILIADDEPTIVDALAMLLDDEGYRVCRAYDGREALRIISDDPPDVIVSDVMMPRIDGLSLTRRLRDRGDPTPVVLMSAVYADVDIPGVRFVPKPFDLDYIVQVVHRVVKELDGRPR